MDPTLVRGWSGRRPGAGFGLDDVAKIRRVSARSGFLLAPSVGLSAMDWSIFHAVNGGVATRDWLEDPVTTLSQAPLPLYAMAVICLWSLAPPSRERRWEL